MRDSILISRRAACAGPLLLGAFGRKASAAIGLAAPVFQVNVDRPTQDKPQSKLWFAQGVWWAWLPVQGGSSVWKRSSDGWQRQTYLDAALQGLPGQADVWADRDTATAVLVAPERLAVVSLRWDAATHRYALAASPARLVTYPKQAPDEGIETATIARDGRGRWWVAYNWQREMYVRHSIGDAVTSWSEPIAVSAAKANADDICAIVALPGSVAVVWSDQDHDAVYFRQHEDGAAPEAWKPIETADSGGRTADDHISMAVAGDGTLYIATKNSVDEMGKPQQVLRIRDPKGKWTNLPFAPLTSAGGPSRPIVLLGGADRLLLVYSLYRKDGLNPRVDAIVWQGTTRRALDVGQKAAVLLDSGGQLNNATSLKGPLPAGQPWIVLASDPQGRIFEGRLR
ncbi:MAG: hypothetical protein KJZ70_09155 [Bryobacterales bacterium]|nr:hypothetical protein [Bryobacterales bacterium]